MTIKSEPLPGVFLLKPRVFSDHRGFFVKTFQDEAYRELGFQFQPTEEFYSSSQKNVLRGMHFQVPPQDHAKLVYCLKGGVLDVLLDLRKESPMFGQAVSAELSSKNYLQFYIPRGVAHGFLALVDDSVMIYKTSTSHSPVHDAGIRWDSFGFDWGVGAPIISTRDAGLAAFEVFTSPF